MKTEGGFDEYRVLILVPFIQAVSFEGEYNQGDNKDVDQLVEFSDFDKKIKYDAESAVTTIHVPLFTYGSFISVRAAEKERIYWQSRVSDEV